jgi:2-dehydropantoate 2-reductase
MHILGCGSIGLLYASAIHNTYYKQRRNDNKQPPVTLLMRPHHKPRLIQQDTNDLFASITIQRGTTIRRCEIPVEIISNSEHNSPIKRVLLCTKANDAVAAIESIWHRLNQSPSGSKIIILSNGALAIRDGIYKHFGKHHGVKLVLGTTTHGAHTTATSNVSNQSKPSYDIIHAGDGSTYCTDEEFIRICQSVGYDSAVQSELQMNCILWRKLAVNCVINPLTAIHNVKNGQLLDTKHQEQDIKVITKSILEEISRIAILEMTELIEKEMEGDSLAQVMLSSLSISSLEKFVFRVMLDTSDNISSMLQDVRANRVTEVQFLNGYMVSLGKAKHGIDCPYNTEMVRLVENLKS